MASAACCGYAIVLVAHALGLGAVWKSPPFRNGTPIRSLCQLTGTEQLLGWVNVGGTDDEVGCRSALFPISLRSPAN